MIDLLVIGNPTIDYIEGEFFGPGGPVTHISNSLAQLGQNKIDIVIIGPEKPLVEGIVDFLKKNNIKVFGIYCSIFFF